MCGWIILGCVLLSALAAVTVWASARVGSWSDERWGRG